MFVENHNDGRLIEQIAAKTDFSIGDMLYSGSLSGSDGPAGTCLDMMRHNAATVAEALVE